MSTVVSYAARRAAQKERVRLLHTRPPKDTLNCAAHRIFFYRDLIYSCIKSSHGPIFPQYVTPNAGIPFSHAVRCFSASLRCIPDYVIVGTPYGVNIFSQALYGVNSFRYFTTRALIRCYRGTPEVSYRRNDELTFQKGYNGGKFSKREKKTEAPVEAPYISPKRTKFSPNKTIDIFEGMTLVELSKRTSQSVPIIQNILVSMGEKPLSEYEPLSIDVAELIAMDAGINVRRLQSGVGTKILPKPAVVTVMGHVDHGKTSLLDALRQTSVAAREAGGITQHVGAFVVGMSSGASITFLDTPGHAAFSAMRARGAAVTDIVVLVVAADDGVMPQTIEAMSHARAADVPIVVAINKCDKPAADPERVKIQLASEGLLLEEMGGDVQVVNVSALKKTGLDGLEEALLLQAELMDLKAYIDGPTQAYVVEARLDRGRGPLVTAIVKAGTLLCGQHVVVGAQWGRIRSLRDTAGRVTDRATPSIPVEIEGLKGLPMAGDDVIVVGSEERARVLSSVRNKKLIKQRIEKINEDSIQIPDSPEEETIKRVEFPIIIKADVQGTVQAVSDSLKTLNSEQVFVNVVHVGVGPVSQSDVDLAQTCDACIVGFNVRGPPTQASVSAAQAGIKIKIHRVIYHLLEDVGNLIVDKAPGTLETRVAGEAQVLGIFELKGKSRSKEIKKIAGCRVTEGHLTKSWGVRLMRSGVMVFQGCCTSLKREKQDVERVGKGNECGLIVDGCNDFQVGDVIQCLENVKKKPKFISSDNGVVRIEC